MADREIDLLAGEVDVVQRRRDAQVDVRMRLGKMPETIDEPLGGEIRRGADGEHAGILPLQQALGPERDAIEAVAHGGKVVPAGFGEDEPLVLAIEQPDPELGLERLDLVADRALRHEQLRGRAGEALVACRGFEGAQRIQWREALPHEKN